MKTDRTTYTFNNAIGHEIEVSITLRMDNRYAFTVRSAKTGEALETPRVFHSKEKAIKLLHTYQYCGLNVSPWVTA